MSAAEVGTYRAKSGECPAFARMRRGTFSQIAPAVEDTPGADVKLTQHSRMDNPSQVATLRMLDRRPE
jgi:hypothetical protein